MRKALRRLLRPRARGQGSPYLEGHQLDLLQGGEFFTKLHRELARAEHYIFIETYILRSDQTGWRVARLLMDRAEAGVEIVLMYDAFGSLGLDPGFLSALREAGAKSHAFRPISFYRGVWPWSRRDHRKMVVIDGRVGIVGGMNIADDYASAEQGGRGWRDSAVAVEGPAVADLERLFRELWQREAKSALATEAQKPKSHSGGMALRFLPNFDRGERALVRRAYLTAILSARERIRITNAYFFPDRSIRRALIRAARRGVQVELIVAGTSDVRPAVLASRSLYARFLRQGIEIYEWHRTVLHAKTAVIDSEWSTVGSSNLDFLSSFVNLEINAGIMSHRFGRIMDEQFERDRSLSRRVDPIKWKHRPWFNKLSELLFRLVAKRY